jgi:hypothetical protein
MITDIPVYLLARSAASRQLGCWPIRWVWIFDSGDFVKDVPRPATYQHVIFDEAASFYSHLDAARQLSVDDHVPP